MGKVREYYQKAVDRISIVVHELKERLLDSKKRFDTWISEQWDYTMFWISDKWQFLKWHFVHMFETDMTDEYLEMCLLFDYHKITFRPMKEKLIYRVTCWREWQPVIQFNVHHLQDADLVKQQMYLVSKEHETRQEHEKYMKLGSDLAHQEVSD